MEHSKTEEQFAQMKQRILDTKLTFPPRMEKEFFRIYQEMLDKGYNTYGMGHKTLVFTKGHHIDSTFDSRGRPKLYDVMVNFFCERFDDQDLPEQDNEDSGPTKIMVITAREDVLEKYKLSKAIFDVVSYSKGNFNFRQSGPIFSWDTKICS